MVRNLDITTLRSFVAVADTGGVTRAASFLNLTQSAVSMQLKRLEELLDTSLLDRTGRGIALTPAGEQLLSYARKIVTLNDQLVGRLTDQAFEGEVALGVPHDIVTPVIPKVLKRFNAMYPRVRVNLVSSNTIELKDAFYKGEFDLILTTETKPTEAGETIHTMPLAWVGAAGGTIWRQRPLRTAFGRICIFRGLATDALEAADIPWDAAVVTQSDRAIEATVSADLAVCVMMEGTVPIGQEVVPHNGELPSLPNQHINMYGADRIRKKYVEDLAVLIRQSYAATLQPALRVAG
jgi:DNA-binding transcriptional LysR family regulator